ncbi:MAG: NADH-quinone oxidoreductase subunit NuoG [Parachlamydiaceae bacterium]|nr:NADH-quinone oxidoreductase subunit NuoG [Parachlamydiaceae bacterium]
MTSQNPELKSQITFTLDGQQITVPKGTTVYTAAKQLKIDIPIFCYQDRMPPFGACRVCLVEVEKMAKPQTSCTLEATEGMVVKTQSPMAAEGRNQILEFLLINHPLDCPVCDRGGECPLQDQTVKFGPGMSRFFEEKRHFKKPIPLGPVLMLDRERCIACARCTRFSDIITGDHALEFIDRGYKTEVGTPDGGPAESKFIGNTIMICPVGALTSNVYRFRARPWDNTPTRSTCTLCPVGCSMILDSRDGEIVRTRSRENRQVNDIWMCDKGWFGYEFVNHPDRLQQPLIRKKGHLVPASWEEALTLIAMKMTDAIPSGKIAGFGGNPLTIEENYLFQKFIRQVAGVNHIDHRIGMPIMSIQEEGLAPGMEMSIGDCEQLSYAIIFGADLTENFPIIWLRLKHAINHGAKVIYFGHYAPEIENLIEKVVVHRPGEELEIINKYKSDIKALSEIGKKGAIFVGSQYLERNNRVEVLSELQILKNANTNLTLNILEGRGNSIGARLAGMRPDVGPFGKEITDKGLNAIEVLETAANSGWKVLYVAGADPAKKFPSKLWGDARFNLDFLIVQDIFLTQTAIQADVVLPTLCYVEKKGSFINIEGRVGEILPGKDVPDYLYSDGDVFKTLAQKLNFSLFIDKEFSDKLKLEKILLEYSKIDKIKEVPKGKVLSNNSLAATFVHALFDNGVRMKHDPHLIQLVKEPRVRINPTEGTTRGINHGDEVSLSLKGNRIKVKAALDKGVALGTIVIPLGFDLIDAHELDANLMNGLEIEIGKI